MDSPPSWFDIILGLFGAGGGYRLLTHEGRIQQLEKHADNANKVGNDVSEMKGKLDGLIGAVSEIREWIMTRAK